VHEDGPAKYVAGLVVCLGVFAVVGSVFAVEPPGAHESHSEDAEQAAEGPQRRFGDDGDQVPEPWP
jgi:hypothetical protein